MSDAPERIYGWLNSQLSIARIFGGCRYAGAHYVIDYAAEGQPLVRVDVVAAERKVARAQARADAEKAREAQVDWLGKPT